VSSQDFSPAPFPVYAEAGTGEPYDIPAEPTRERYWLYSLLFALTLLTTTVVGTGMQSDFDHNIPFDVERAFSLYSWIWRQPAQLLHGFPFSLTLLTILLAHEFGHYLAALYHRVDASLPYFLPSPFLGTFGAFIKVRSPIYSKRVLFDIGVSGPVAGFIFVLPTLAIGLAFSKVIPGIVHQGSLQFGVPLLQRALEMLIFPGAGSADVYLHPVARAAWVGMFTTALNLLPIGQLDGGHILYSFFPSRHRLVSRLMALALLPLCWFWWGWLLWGLGMFWLGRHHPMIIDDHELGDGRRKLGMAALVIFVLCFILIPLRSGGL
jgi:membrane-associated protease RseP (regulator of RpoE activity)